MLGIDGIDLEVLGLEAIVPCSLIFTSYSGPNLLLPRDNHTGLLCVSIIQWRSAHGCHHTPFRFDRGHNEANLR